MSPRIGLMLCCLGGLAGLGFASVSTYDFVAHLDRQVHGLHCSFLPGLAATDASGATGCHVTLMSRYSSVMRSAVWGGVPISLPAMGVFAFLAAWCAWILLRRREHDTSATGFLFLATLLPVASSIVMGFLSFVELGAACKLCIGIYIASAIVFVGALITWLGARNVARWTATEQALSEPPPASDTDGLEDPYAHVPRRGPQPLGLGALVMAFVTGVAFVVVPVVTYASSAPDFGRYVGACGSLADRKDPEGVLVPLGPQDRAEVLIEMLDPLCPACRGFEARYAEQPAAAQLARKALLFPLDGECNWMIDGPVHPGACVVSEAMLCDPSSAEQILHWAFEEHEAITAAAKAGPDRAAAMVRARFPKAGACVGSPAVRAKLNLGLRWAVKNQLQVLTPQVFVGGWRLCDEDTDLGLAWALPRLVERARTQPPPVRETAPAPPVPPAIARAPRSAQAPAPAATPTAVAAAPAAAPGGEAEPAAPAAKPAAVSEAEPTALAAKPAAPVLEADPEPAAPAPKPAAEPPPPPEPPAPSEPSEQGAAE